MQKKMILGLMGGLITLGGCAAYSQAPQPTNFQTQAQSHIRAASHWQMIAADSAKQLISAFPEKQPLYVVRTSSESPFEEAFRSQLVTELSRAGYPVMKSDQRPGTLLVDVSAQPIQFSESRARPTAAGELTLIAGGLWVLRDIYEKVSPGAAVMAGAVALDASRWFGAKYSMDKTVPKTELLVTTNISSADRIFAQTTDAYYTTQSDWGLYARSVLIPVKGGL